MAVYIVQAGDTNRIKIGYTTRSYRKRIKELQTGCPEPLKLLHVFPDADENVESKLHKVFSETRLHGEWFEMDSTTREELRIITQFPSINDDLGYLTLAFLTLSAEAYESIKWLDINNPPDDYEEYDLYALRVEQKQYEKRLAGYSSNPNILRGLLTRYKYARESC